MPKIFKGYRIAITGDFGKDKRPEDFKRWIEDKDGKFAAEIDLQTTHLICSEEDWALKVQAVQDANRIKGCKVVKYEWFSDCIVDKRRHNEGPYLLKKVAKVTAAHRAARKENDRKAMKKDSVASYAADWMGGHLGEIEAAIDKKKKQKQAKGTLFNELSRELGAKSSGEGSDDEEDDESEDEEYMSGGLAVDGLDMATPETSAKDTETPSASPTSSGNPDLKTKASSSEDNTSTDPKKKPKKPRKKKESTSEMASCFKINHPVPPPDQPATKPADNTDDEIANHHLYRDDTGFTYNIILVRADLRKNQNERYFLRLYESHTTPKSYATHLRYVGRTPPSDMLFPAQGVRVAPVGSSFGDAWKAFTGAFTEKTGRSWDERGEKGVPFGVTIEGGMKPYLYIRPKEFEPKGMMSPEMVKAGAAAARAQVAAERAEQAEAMAAIQDAAQEVS